MLSETRYARNGDLRVAYRASAEGARDIVFVPNWFFCCEVLPELPSVQGWVEAMTSLGRIIFFDHPGSGLSDPVTPGALPTVEQWADSITAVLDDLDSREAVILCSLFNAFAPGALFAATHPSRTTALIALEGYADTTTVERARESVAESAAMWGTGEVEHFLNPDMPWNEEIRAAWARHERMAASPAMVDMMLPLMTDLDVRAVLPAIRVPTLVMQHTDHPVHATWGHTRKYIADHIQGAKYVELPGRNFYHFVEPWRDSFQVIAEFLTGQQPDLADDRVLATVLFTDIVDSTRRAAEIGDRDWHALLDAHDAVVRSQLARFRGREVNTSGDGFLAMFDGPQRAIRCAMAIRDAVQVARHRGAGGVAHRRVRGAWRGYRRDRGAHRGAGECVGGAERGVGVEHAARSGDWFGAGVRGARRA